VEAMENGSASASKGSDVSVMTNSILNCERRIAELARQKGLVKELRRSLDAIVEDGSNRSGGQSAAKG
ncbi:MAG: hypothetical protein E5X72_33310, partial [Mesorhizobium sp.]